MGLNPDEKMILLNLSRKGSWVTDYIESRDFHDNMRSLSVGVNSTRVDRDWKGDYAYRLYLNDFGELAVRVGMDLLEDVAKIRAEREEVEGAE